MGAARFFIVFSHPFSSFPPFHLFPGLRRAGIHTTCHPSDCVVCWSRSLTYQGVPVHGLRGTRTVPVRRRIQCGYRLHRAGSEVRHHSPYGTLDSVNFIKVIEDFCTCVLAVHICCEGSGVGKTIPAKREKIGVF